MKYDLSKIHFYFPQFSGKIKDKNLLAQSIIDMMQKDGSIEYSGYLNNKDLRNALLMKMNKLDYPNYRIPTNVERRRIIKEINISLKKCYTALQHPELPIFIFVFPWFPSIKDDNVFGGVDAVAPHKNVMHIFMNLDTYKLRSLKETIAHEYNHLIFYYYQWSKNYSLIQNIIMEGLAENFREDVIGGNSSPWAIALTRKEANKAFFLIKRFFNSKNAELSKNILFGGGKYKRWTGYSIGYWIVKNFKQQHATLSWQKIMQLKVDNLCQIKK